MGANPTGRFAVLRHPSGAVSTLTPDTQEIRTHALGHGVTRFTHCGVLTAAIGEEGVSVFLGHDRLSTTLRYGPHRFVNGQLLVNNGFPDVNGTEVRGNTLGTLELPAYAGTPVVAGEYRGLTLAVFQDGLLFSSWGGIETGRSYIRAQTFSDHYTHPHLRFLGVACEAGLLYSVDESRSWQLHELGGWPVRFAAGDCWVIRNAEVSRV